MTETRSPIEPDYFFGSAEASVECLSPGEDRSRAEVRKWPGGPGCERSHSPVKGESARADRRRWIWVTIRLLFWVLGGIAGTCSE